MPDYEIKESSADKLVIVAAGDGGAKQKLKLIRHEPGKNTLDWSIGQDQDDDEEIFLNNEYCKVVRDWLDGFLQK